MSTQKGNSSRSRPQKHQNRTAFKNSLHDTSQKTKEINAIQVNNVCQRCKDIIEWKIKYKKYKPLTQPKKCVKCGEKTVKKAYHIVCDPCGQKTGICAKCGQRKDLIIASTVQQSMLQQDPEIKELLKSLPERKRRTFLRFMAKNEKEPLSENKEEILKKLEALKMDGEEHLEEFSSECSSDNE
ncbi:hypothetical protein ABEB36_011757 [Hypothenemus hampei]|uniref:Uncharacterized protein n=1 Tax=Hypothenemus hampei TaxID=57062 RepID=A0ABD1E958_HYPHA